MAFGSRGFGRMYFAEAGFVHGDRHGVSAGRAVAASGGSGGSLSSGSSRGSGKPADRTAGRAERGE